MLQKKICMLGSFAVGKTSLVQRFVHSKFSEKYLTTVGVKIDRKEVALDAETVNLVLWDIAGEDECFTVPTSYLRGSAGHFLVIDGTRRSTVDQALDLQARVEAALGPVPFSVVLNKIDLVEEWELGEDVIRGFEDRRWTVMRTSAKTGAGVEEAFRHLATTIVEQS